MSNSLNYNPVESQIKQAIQGIESGFIWIDTPNGHEYWSTVRDNLEALLPKEDEKCPENIEINGVKYRKV